LKFAIFTYYSENVVDIFVKNIESLIYNLDEEPDHLVICSESEIPSKILTALSQSVNIVKLYPDYNSKLAKKRSTGKFIVNPSIISAFSYTGADKLTVIDPNIFIVNRVPISNTSNTFYKNHTGTISSSLFTVNLNSTVANAAAAAFSIADFGVQSIIGMFSYFIANSPSFSDKSISHYFIFREPVTAASPNIDKLIAIDLFDSVGKPYFKELFQIRDLHINKNKSTSLTKIIKKTGSIAKSIVKSIPLISEPSITDPTIAKEIKLVKSSRKLTNLSKMTPLIISFHSDSNNRNYYLNFAEKLKRQCSQFSIKHDIVKKEPIGDYSSNCLMKPQFILEKLIEYKKPLIWMDCDTTFKEPFAEFNEIGEDLAMATHSGDMTGIKASPIFFNYTVGAFKVIREWVIHSSCALAKGIVELDHDAIKHYVIPKLESEFSVKLLSDNWMDFVHGRYIDNGNSNMPEKGEVFRKVNSLTDNQRWNISAGTKTFNIKFSGTEDSVFANAYTCLLNFSNTSRIRFCFDESLKTSKSKYLKKLIVESGNEIFFYDFLTKELNSTDIEITEDYNWEKNWDKIWNK